MMIKFGFPKPSDRCLSRWLAIAVISVIGWGAEISTPLSRTPTFSWFNQTAHAQSRVSNLEVLNYANAILDIEPIRQNAYEQIQNQLGSVPPIDCSQPENLNGLTPQVRQIANNYCTESEVVVENNGLTTERFNEITRLQQNNPSLRDRIRNEIIQVQQERSQSAPAKAEQ